MLSCGARDATLNKVRFILRAACLTEIIVSHVPLKPFAARVVAERRLGDGETLFRFLFSISLMSFRAKLWMRMQGCCARAFDEYSLVWMCWKVHWLHVSSRLVFRIAFLLVDSYFAISSRILCAVSRLISISLSLSRTALAPIAPGVLRRHAVGGLVDDHPIFPKGVAPQAELTPTFFQINSPNVQNMRPRRAHCATPPSA